VVLVWVVLCEFVDGNGDGMLGTELAGGVVGAGKGTVFDDARGGIATPGALWELTSSIFHPTAPRLRVLCVSVVKRMCALTKAIIIRATTSTTSTVKQNV